MAAQQVFRGFFSYAHHDARTYPQFVKAFVDRLEGSVSGELTNASLEIWRDKDGLRTGDKWDRKIEQELRSSQVLIVLLSPKWIESHYCRKEYTIFEEVEAAEKNYVAPILIRDVENQARHFDDDQKQIFAKLKQRQFAVVLAGYSTRPNVKEVDKIARDISEMIEQLRPVARGARAESVEARPRAEDIIDTIIAKTPAGGLDPNVVRELALRLKPDEALDPDQAVKALANSGEIAREVIAKGERLTNQESFVAEVSKQVAEATSSALPRPSRRLSWNSTDASRRPAKPREEPARPCSSWGSSRTAYAGTPSPPRRGSKPSSRSRRRRSLSGRRPIERDRIGLTTKGDTKE